MYLLYLFPLRHLWQRMETPIQSTSFLWLKAGWGESVSCWEQSLGKSVRASWQLSSPMPSPTLRTSCLWLTATAWDGNSWHSYLGFYSIVLELLDDLMSSTPSAPHSDSIESKNLPKTYSGHFLEDLINPGQTGFLHRKIENMEKPNWEEVLNISSIKMFYLKC